MPAVPPKRLIVHLDGGLVQGVYSVGFEADFPVDVIDTDTDGTPDKELIVTSYADPERPQAGPQKIRAYIHSDDIPELSPTCDLHALLEAFDHAD